VLTQLQSVTGSDDKKSDERKEDGIGINHIIYDCSNPKFELDEIYKHPKLPTITEVLDGMGLGPKGPPIPPPATFSVVPYPAYRKAPPCLEFGHYYFVTNMENDPNLYPDDKSKEAVIQETIEEEKAPEPAKVDKTKKPLRGVTSRTDSKSEPRKTSGDKKRESTIKTARRESVMYSTSPVESSRVTAMSQSENDGSDQQTAQPEKKSHLLQRFRWSIPANGEIVIRLRFLSEEIGQFDQTLNFEIVGTRRRYQLYCRGICCFPTISREPRIVFPNRKKCIVKDEIVSKKYILNEELYEFGPLLIGNNKDRIREGKFPEYQETLTVANISPMEAEINFCYLEEHSDKDQCFFLDPPEMTLKPNETRILKIFAAPKEAKSYHDSIICCIKENPEPVLFRVSCSGQKPELQLDKKEFYFKQVLLHRKDTREIRMTNQTRIPVLWRLEGVDLLGDEFVCNQTSGILEPNQGFNLVLHFRALKPLTITGKEKKALKLLVSDVNSFLGFMENHTVYVMAEAYDVALEINLPKGNDGGLDFGNIRVNTENKQVCNLKNKGKYPIKFNFILESQNQNEAENELIKYLSIVPSSGELLSMHDRNAQHQAVQVILNTKKEVFVKDATVIKCQITEPQMNDGTIIANIPIKISCKAIYSKFNIIPQTEINFGIVSVMSKRQERLIIENKGDYDFKYTITKYVRENGKTNLKVNVTKDDKNKLRENSSQTMTKTTTKRNESVREGGGGGGAVQGRFQVGVYTITPAYGLILQNGHQAITVDCAPETSGKFEEELLIDITDRNTNQYPNGIVYRFFVEAVIPTIAITPDIFEEHTVIQNISALDPKTMGLGIYCEDENKFIFNNVIVGRTSKARFKLFNTNKIAIDVAFYLKSMQRNTKSVQESVFDLDTTRVQIQPHNYAYATVSFTPLAMISYNTVFEATLENVGSTVKNKTISFDIVGDGNLPRFNVLKPSTRNKKGQFIMYFKKSVVGHQDNQSLILQNEGSLATKVRVLLFLRGILILFELAKYLS
jgi:hydrocephalus-inducing protein